MNRVNCSAKYWGGQWPPRYWHHRGEGDEIESNLPFKIFSTLYFCKNIFNISISFLFKVAEVAGYMTPVPGGVGPCTVACLLYNTVIAAKRQNLEAKLSSPN